MNWIAKIIKIEESLICLVSHIRIEEPGAELGERHFLVAPAFKTGSRRIANFSQPEPHGQCHTKLDNRAKPCLKKTNPGTNKQTTALEMKAKPPSEPKLVSNLLLRREKENSLCQPWFHDPSGEWLAWASLYE